MGDINIRFRFETGTGKKEIVIEYESDDDLLPVEHERKHRRIVERLVGEGVLDPGDASEVKVERVVPAHKQPQTREAPPGREPVKT